MNAPTRLSTPALLERLVAFDTTSRNGNLGLIDFVRGYLDGYDVPVRLSHDATGRKANIHAVIGPRQAGGLALSGHVDTVPVDGQAWTGDPFVLRRSDGRFYARGACDMKGFVAACLAAVPDLLAMRPSRPLHLFITFDEEVGCYGAQRLIRDLQESGLRPDACVIGEPTGMQPVLAHKGKMNVDVAVRGRPGHSSQPANGVNAVYAAAEAVAQIAAESRRLAVEGPFAEGFDPPHTTIHVGTIQGGSILNIIPEHAAFGMEWRCIPGESPLDHLDRLRGRVARTIEPAMRAVHPTCGFTFNVVVNMPGMALPEDHYLAGVVKQVTGSNSTAKVSYGTEGGYYEQAGIPAIVCGPGHIAQAHQPDEWIAASELSACDQFIRRLAERLAG